MSKRIDSSAREITLAVQYVPYSRMCNIMAGWGMPQDTIERILLDERNKNRAVLVDKGFFTEELVRIVRTGLSYTMEYLACR